MMNRSKLSGLRRACGIPTLPSPLPQPSPSGRGSTGFRLGPNAAHGMILPDWMTISLSPGERARVRGNCPLPSVPRRTLQEALQHSDSSGRAGGFPNSG